MSHPSWVCGLKLVQGSESLLELPVTPFVGVWIETSTSGWKQTEKSVTPFVGVWIETAFFSSKPNPATSHPSWVCGLKHGQHLHPA